MTNYFLDTNIVTIFIEKYRNAYKNLLISTRITLLPPLNEVVSLVLYPLDERYVVLTPATDGLRPPISLNSKPH